MFLPTSCYPSVSRYQSFDLEKTRKVAWKREFKDSIKREIEIQKHVNFISKNSKTSKITKNKNNKKIRRKKLETEKLLKYKLCL